MKRRAKASETVKKELQSIPEQMETDEIDDSLNFTLRVSGNFQGSSFAY